MQENLYSLEREESAYCYDQGPISLLGNSCNWRDTPRTLIRLIKMMHSSILGRT